MATVLTSALSPMRSMASVRWKNQNGANLAGLLFRNNFFSVVGGRGWLGYSRSILSSSASHF
jgi:hypothetical protein